MSPGNAILFDVLDDTVDTGVLTYGAALSDEFQVSDALCFKDIRVADSTTDIDYTTTSRFEKAYDDLIRLANLPFDWDSYGSPKIPNELIKTAEIFLDSLEYEDITQLLIVPVSGGGIQFEWQIGDRELELEFIDSNTIAYLKVCNDEPLEEGQFNLNDIIPSRDIIRWLNCS